MIDSHDSDSLLAEDSAESHHPLETDSAPRSPKKIVFDDFQITRAEQEARVEEERRVWKERQQRTEEHKPSIFGFTVPRLKSLRDEMLGVQNRLPFLRRSTREPIEAAPLTPEPHLIDGNEPFFAEHERAVIRVTRKTPVAQDALPVYSPEVVAEPMQEALVEVLEESQEWEAESPAYNVPEVEDELLADIERDESIALEEELESFVGLQSGEDESEVFEDVLPPVTFREPIVNIEDVVDRPAASPAASKPHITQPEIPFEPRIEASHKAYLDALRSFDSVPRRANEARDPRADFVVLLGELLDILREQVDATSAMFFWVNPKRQQLVLESAALDDRAYQFLVSDKRFPIELDAVSRIVSRRAPELISSMPAQGELDLIPYYREGIGIASFAGMPVLFGEGLVAVLTVDSVIDDNFTQETLRILTSHSKLISGLIRSYIEKYDLLAAARTLDAARKLHQIVSPDPSLRVLRDQRKNPDYVIRALSEAASEIVDWDWLAAVSFDDARRVWSISSLQSKRGGAYVPPMTAVTLTESLVGKCLQSGQSLRQDALGTQSIRFNTEEDRHAASGHSFLVIPIRTTTKNYGALAIEHSDKAHYTEADVETLEHLARSAAVALEIIALSEIVSERALTDLLTGALNKRGLLMRSGEELARAMQFDEPLTFALFEIDGAAELNSRFSQEDSDTIVLAIARLMRFGARAFDIVARTGEFTFAALLVKMTDEEAYLWCEKMRKMIVSEVIAIGRRSFSVTVSIGVSGARRDGTVDELIEGAELALERAREVGGNNVIVY
jgi:diguanylate cyclase (GGDEF)-like protein